MSYRAFYRIAALVVVSACGVLHAQVSCGNYSLRGTWIYTYQGTVLTSQPGAEQPVPVPVVMQGVGWMYEAGKGGGWVTMSFGGEIMELEWVDCSSQISADCTGTITCGAKVKGTNTVLPGQAVEKIFIAPDGSEVRSILIKGLMGKPIVLGTWKRISLLPVPIN